MGGTWSFEESTYGSTTDGDGDPPPEQTWWVRLNDDFDRMKAGDPIARDNQDALLENDELGDGQLFYLPVTHTSSGGDANDFATFTLDFPSNFKVYRPADNPEVDPVWAQITSGATFTTDPQSGDPYVPSGFIFDPVEATQGPVDIQMTMSRGGSTVKDTVRVVVGNVDLDVDSDNNDGPGAPTGSATEDYLEDRLNEPGKLVAVNNGDTDGDGIPDFADGYDLSSADADDDASTGAPNFTPLTIKLPQAIDPAPAKIHFTYDASHPLSRLIPPTVSPDRRHAVSGGRLRLWTKPGNEARDGHSLESGGDFIKSGVEYRWDALTMSAPTTTLWLEAVAPSATVGDQFIQVWVDPDGDGPASFATTDVVRVTAVRFDMVTSSAPYVLMPSLEKPVSNLLGWWGDDHVGPAPVKPVLRLRTTPDIDSLLPSVPLWESSPGMQLIPDPGNRAKITIASAAVGRRFVKGSYGELGVGKTVWIDFPDVGEAGTGAAAAAYPGAAVDARFAFREKASAFGASFAGGGATGEGNAMQHAYWNALITYVHGPAASRALTTAYEHDSRVGGHVPFDSVMDLHNNEIGIQVGLAARAAVGGAPVPLANVEPGMQQALIERFHAGNMYVVDDYSLMIVRSDGTPVHK
ncbi:MAG TPA: hypothetical protein VER17_05250 [Tepidisphaeraceae bacterium]|nr:hypothetical protein [Tepidisphaeraceae bacterium]